MKFLRLPLWLILLGSLLLTSMFGWMLSQGLNNYRTALDRDLAFQAQEQGISINATRAGLEQRAEVLAAIMAADPALRTALMAVSTTSGDDERNRIRERLRADLTPYWHTLTEGQALELNLFSVDEGAISPLLGMTPPGATQEQPSDERVLLRESLDRGIPRQGVEYDGVRATTVGVAPIFAPGTEDDSAPPIGFVEVEFGVVTGVDELSRQLSTSLATLVRQGADADTPWRVEASSRPAIQQWMTQGVLPESIRQVSHQVVDGGDGKHYLMTLVPVFQSGGEDRPAIAAVALWKDITPQLAALDAVATNIWLRWGVAWLVAEACLLLLLWGTRRATRDTMLRHQQRLESQKSTLESLNRRLEAQKETLETLNDIAALQETSFQRLVEKALQVGAEHLGMPFAVVNRIDGEDSLIQAAYSPDRHFEPGQRLSTGDTFSELTLTGGDVIAFADADEAGLAEHPCRLRYELRSYIGAPIWMHGRRYGALAFSSEKTYPRAFDEVDKEFVRLLARWIGATLMRWQDVQAREELSKRLTKIASQTPGMIYQYRLDAEGHSSFPYASEAIKTYYGLTPAQAAKDSSQIIEAIVEEDRPHVIASIQASRENLTPWHCEYRVRHPDGRILWLAGQSIPEREADGATLWHGFVHDITERKRDERLKSEFISTVSHELRTPLTSISGSLGLIQGGALGTPPESMRSMLSVAHSNAQRLIMLINDLLDMEKLVAGKMTFQMVEQPLMPLIDHAIEANQAYADQFQAQYVVTERHDAAVVTVDAMRLQQVMSNLLSNAAKFSPPNTQVEVRVEAIADRIRVSVIDHGPGIPEAFHERIFQKFSQADASSTRKQGGTGLGLAITRELVERMRGSINFFSEEGHGACFFIELPYVEHLSNEQQASSEATSAQADEDTLSASGTPGFDEITARGTRLLIVEDDPDTALLLATLVRHWGYRAEIAHTMTEALKWLERRSFDAITLDLMLPDGNGLTLLRQLREQPQTRELPVLIVSAAAEEGQLEIGGRLEAVDWLAKPFDEKRLAGALHDSLSLRPRRERILHIESDAELSQRIAEQVASSITLDVARSLQEARYLLDSHEYGLISLDLTASKGPGWEVIPVLSQMVRQPAVVILSEEALAPTLLGRVKTAIAKPGLSAEALMAAFDRQLHDAQAPLDDGRERDAQHARQNDQEDKDKS